MKVNNIVIIIVAVFILGAILTALTLQPKVVLKTTKLTVTEITTEFQETTVTESKPVTKTITVLRPTVSTETATTTYTVTELLTVTETVAGKEGAKVLGVCFSPDEYCLNMILSFLSRAQHSIYAMIYIFTLDDIADALIDAASRGVDVKVLIEADNALIKGSEYSRLLANGIEVRLDANKYLMHNKVAIIDGRIVITGSLNWSFSGVFRNNENIIVLEDPGTASEFMTEFNRLWKMAS